MIYVISLDDSQIVKIGHGKNPKQRVGELQIGSPTPLILQWVHEGDEALENHLHAVFEEHRIRGEWFDLTSLGSAVAAVQSAVAAAVESGLLKASRFRGPAVVHPATTAVPPNRQHPRPTGRIAESPAPTGQNMSWEDRFPRAVRPAAPQASADRTIKPGCIRAWKGECHRPAGTTCNC